MRRSKRVRRKGETKRRWSQLSQPKEAGKIVRPKGVSREDWNRLKKEWTQLEEGLRPQKKPRDAQWTGPVVPNKDVIRDYHNRLKPYNVSADEAAERWLLAHYGDNPKAIPELFHPKIPKGRPPTIEERRARTAEVNEFLNGTADGRYQYWINDPDRKDIAHFTPGGHWFMVQITPEFTKKSITYRTKQRLQEAWLAKPSQIIWIEILPHP